MKKWMCLAAISALVFSATAQTYVYSHEWMYFDSLKYTLRDGHIIPGKSSLRSESVLTVTNSGIFKGYSTSTFDLLFTYKDEHLYSDRGTVLSDLLFTVKNGKVYRGESTLSMDCLFNYDAKSGKIYRGDSTFSLDVVLWLQGEALTNVELCAVLLIMEML